MKLIARYLREAGLIGQQSTGGGAAKMTASDAASLLIAVNGSSPAKDAAQSVAEFWHLPLRTTFHEQMTDDLKYLEGEVLAETFGETLERVISLFMDEPSGLLLSGEVDGPSYIRLRIEFERPGPEASIGIWTSPDGGQGRTSGLSMYFMHDEAEAEVDRNISIKITHRTIGSVITALQS
ncbi:hypothetical protein ACRBEV_10080 [Methylobacterium phyllosphaerae]